jgi:hypothetical protein
MLIPKTPEQREKRVRQVRDGQRARYMALADKYRANLTEWYGADGAAKIKCAEAFEVCEYGSKPSKEELAKLFPFFDKK